MKKRKDYHRIGSPDFPVSIGIEVAGKNMRTRPAANYHRATEIALQVAGTSLNQVEDQIVTRQPGDIWIIPSGVSHRRIEFSADSVIHWILFTPEAISMDSEHFFQNKFVKPLSEGRLEMPPLIQPGHPCYQALHQALLHAKDCPYYKNDYKEKRFLLLMQICLTLTPYCQIREEQPVIPENVPEPVRHCLGYICNRYHKKIEMKDIAAYCHLHPSRLSALFKQHTGQSVFEYLTRFRVETAAGLLRQEDLPVSKVAELVGFRSECLFYRKFKEIMGVTPKKYANQQKSS